jgi:hypothetical protein
VNADEEEVHFRMNCIFDPRQVAKESKWPIDHTFSKKILLYLAKNNWI